MHCRTIESTLYVKMLLILLVTPFRTFLPNPACIIHQIHVVVRGRGLFMKCEVGSNFLLSTVLLLYAVAESKIMASECQDPILFLDETHRRHPYID